MENKRTESFLFELVSPEKLVFSEKVVSVVLPSASGYLTVMANHAPVVVSLIPGVIRVISSSGEKVFALLGGIADITSAGCSLLAETVVVVDHLSFHDLEQRMAEVRVMMEENSSGKTHNKVKEVFHKLTSVDGVSTVA
ncbi:ATP synthase epsilon chain (ATP synthase F1 sector epsilon subunit) [Bartonella clarridgeiae 73]|uniref:ATP synthase epsilon chain n=1 Tax=Bartonella clarridgeiae (strain CCUG 45776 / CIP 104772 / 73) TaxID=696125 RepID=E6YJA4_BARC7|nr:ATP synthase F1 subunit epsilon [Bartonella clarridgeiae]WCR55823.1 MAG: ATP synthase epsilon chain [Bartonella clarridgeiae]CBI76942.1 ATP synthase epsilon chain (ATP synthase F1 sector epsilon subunit) [Bartonella clarridgeiae 73]